MKTRLLIIIGIIVAASVTLVVLEYDQKTKSFMEIIAIDVKFESIHVPDPICFVVDRSSPDNIGGNVTLDTCITLDQFEEMGCTKPMLEHILEFSNLLDHEVDGLIYLKWVGLPNGVSQEKFDDCFDAISEKRTVSETKKLWKSTDDWNFLNLIRNNDNLYCSSANEELIDHCYSLENIVFGDGGKKKETGWKLYPGGAGWTLPENSTLVPIYKEVEFGIPPLDFTAMLDDKIFVNKCESNGGMWNYTRHDCEGLWEVCPDIGGITIQEDITPPCIDTGIIDDDPLTVKVCHGAGVIRASCVFEYEN
ncbi:hypothetical protein [Nitrosopumilus sp.]|uniref:hypothetical protein n=1 Tax=Nitrosopumilus sp. TaxID=2024843 RepID=UPI003D1366B7